MIFINGCFLFRKNIKIFFLFYNMFKWEFFLSVKGSKYVTSFVPFVLWESLWFFFLFWLLRKMLTPKKYHVLVGVGGRRRGEDPTPKTKVGNHFCFCIFNRVSVDTAGWGTKAQYFRPPYLETWFFYVVFNAELTGAIRILCFRYAIIDLLWHSLVMLGSK